MSVQLVSALIELIVPEVIENIAPKASCFRTMIISLPEYIDKDEILSELRKMPAGKSLWKVIDDY